MAQRSPLVYIIILHWKNLAHTRRCLESLRATTYQPQHIVLVDNHSADGSLETLQQAFPEVTYLPLPANYGFAGGNNPGIRYALAQGADYVLLLNNDTLVPADMVDLLVAAAESHQRLGVLSPKVVWEAHRTTLAGLGFRRSPYGFKLVGWNQPDPGPLDGQPVPIDVVFGCAMLIKREVLQRVGLLDEDFFFYYEDADFCTRVGAAGYDIAYLPSTALVHAVSLSTKGRGGQREFYLARSRQIFWRKHIRGWRRGVFFVYESLELVRMLVIYLRDKMPQAASGYLRGTFAGLRHTLPATKGPQRASILKQ